MQRVDKICLERLAIRELHHAAKVRPFPARRLVLAHMRLQQPWNLSLQRQYLPLRALLLLFCSSRYPSQGEYVNIHSSSGFRVGAYPKSVARVRSLAYSNRTPPDRHIP